MGCLFCCCKKKRYLEYNGDIEIKLISEEDEFDKAVKYKRKVLEMCISEDERYKHFIDIIKDFSDFQINALFDASIAFYVYKGTKEKIEGYEDKFRSLFRKIEDLNFMLQEWYLEPSKHKYIKKFWLSKLKVSELIEKDILERRELLKQNFEGDELNKIELILYDAPEYRAKSIYDDIKNNKDFYSLIEMSLQNHDNIDEQQKKADYIGDNEKSDINGIYLNKSKNMIDSVIKKTVECIEKYIPKKIKNSKYTEKITEIVQNKIWNKAKNPFEIKFDTIFNLAKKFKNGDVILSFIKDIKNYYSNPLGCICTVAFSFINLYQSISSFYKTPIIYRGKRKEFADRLKMINSNFNNHIKKIEGLDINKVDDLIKAEELIISIGREVEQDRKDVIELTKEIEKEIDELKKHNKKNAASLTATVLGTLGCSIGVVASGGVLGIFFGVGAIANATATGVKSANIVKTKKEIKEFQNLLEEAYNQYEQIRNAIEELEIKYNLIQSKYD